MADLPRLKPVEAIEALEARGRNLVPTRSWRDLTPAEHLTSFTVGKSEGFDILEDIHAALVFNLNEGETFRMFCRRLEPVLKAKGWWGEWLMKEDGWPVKPNEEGELEGLGKPEISYEMIDRGCRNRLETIYNVNLRLSYAAGRWAQIQRVKKNRHYLRYSAVRDAGTRSEHLQWGGIVLPIDHPFWETRYPPNGRYCRCSVMSLSEYDLKRYGLIVTPDEDIPDFGWEEHSFLRRGQLVTEVVPRGVEPGFAYHFGAGAFG